MIPPQANQLLRPGCVSRALTGRGHKASNYRTVR
jgi:hypothetical protein